MALTNFPNGLSSFGVPVLGGINGIPLTGTWWFCDYVNGSDGNEGTSPEFPLKTLAAAYAKTVSGKNDVVVMIGDGSTTGTQRLSASLTWANNATHLIGVTAPAAISQRARISHLTTATTNINPLMTVSGSGCLFANFSFFQGIGQAATDEDLIDVTGDRNCFQNIHFGGMGHTNGATRSGSYIIGLNGGDENLFERCTIGLDTVARTQANANVKLVAASQRNMFLDCLFNMYPTAATPLFVNANLSGGLNGSSMWFKRCTFAALLGATGGTQPSVTATVAADINGDVYFDNSSTVAAKWVAATARAHVTGPAANGFSGGVFANAADA